MCDGRTTFAQNIFRAHGGGVWAGNGGGDGGVSGTHGGSHGGGLVEKEARTWAFMHPTTKVRMRANEYRVRYLLSGSYCTCAGEL